MIVMKFGGTSIQDVKAVHRVVDIVRARISLRPIVVNSAMGKTTRNLLTIAQTASTGDHETALQHLDALIAYHHGLASQVIADFNASEMTGKLESFYDELHKLIEGIAVLRDLTPRSQDKFLAYGELISTTILAGALLSGGIDSIWLDARDLMITDDRFTQAHPLLDLTNTKLRGALLPLIKKGKVPVFQGYIGSTREGATTTLGFEGSDYTAAILGAAVDAKDVQIWKDVPGVMTADPAIYQHPHTVKKISFEEAAALTFFGAKVLHPSSIAPARDKKIPVHVFDSGDPDGVGTELVPESAVSRNVVKSITYKRPVTVCRIRSRDSHTTAYEFAKLTMDVLHQERISPILATSADRTLTLVLNGASNLQHFQDALSQHVRFEWVYNMATVSLIGEGLSVLINPASQIMNHIVDVPVIMISQGVSDLNFTLVVHESDVVRLIEKLHRVFFETLDEGYYL